MSKNFDSCKLDVKQFLHSANRPYSCNDIANNFQNKHNKAAITKALDELVTDKEVIEKINGKQKIFFITQDNFQFNEETLKQLNSLIEQNNKILDDLKKELAEKQKKLKFINSRMTTQEYDNKLKILSERVLKLREKVGEIENCINESTETNMQYRQEIKDKQCKLDNELRKRKRLTCDMIDLIMENYPKSKKAFIEEVGIETDEDNSVI